MVIIRVTSLHGLKSTCDAVCVLKGVAVESVGEVIIFISINIFIDQVRRTLLPSR